MLALLGLVFPFIKMFLGDNLVEKLLNHKKDLAASANERERMNIEADVKTLEIEIQRRALIRDLQLKEYESPLLRWPKFILLISVGMYWAARFQVKTWGLDDFHIAISELSEPETYVSGLVLAYWFLGTKIERMFRK